MDKNTKKTLNIPKTPVEFTNGASATAAVFQVVEGICIVLLDRVNITEVGTPFAVNLPPTNFGCYLTLHNGSTIYAGTASSGKSSLMCSGTAEKQFAQLVYPVADFALDVSYVWTKTA